MQPATLETTTYPSRDGPVLALRGEIDGDAKDALAAAYDSVPATDGCCSTSPTSSTSTRPASP
jgi:hypothetical protein